MVLNRDTTMALITAGICFGFWPLLMKRSTIEPIGNALILSAITSALMVGAFSRTPNARVGMLISGVALFAVVAGILNGLGTIQFLGAMGRIPASDISRAILLMILVQVTTNELGGILLYHAPVTAKKLAGFGAAIVAAILLTL